MDNSFEYNRKQIQQTHEIINVIEQKLNSFLQRKNVVSPDSIKNSNPRHSNETFLLSSKTLDKSSERLADKKFKIQHQDLLNKQTDLLEVGEQEDSRKQNILIGKQNEMIVIKEKQITDRLQKELEIRIQEQRESMHQQFEAQINEITDQTKQQLIEIVQNNEENENQKVQDLKKEVELLKQELKELYQENQRSLEAKNGLQQTYYHLLNMNNAIKRIEGSNSSLSIEKRIESQQYSQPGNLTLALNQYKQELKSLREKNISIQEHMAKELTELRFCMENQTINNTLSQEKPKQFNGLEGSKLFETFNLQNFNDEQISKNSNRSSQESQKLQQIAQTDENQQMMTIGDLSFYLRESLNRPEKQAVLIDSSKFEMVKQGARPEKQSTIQKIPQKNRKINEEKDQTQQRQTLQESSNKLQKIFKDQQIELFQMELQQLKNIVHDKIISKKKTQSRKKNDDNI